MKAAVKNASVAKAEAHLEAMKAQVSAAEAAQARAVAALNEAYKALRQARIAADSDLPKCTIVHTDWRGRVQDDNIRPGVVVRQTPAGMLVVRYVGEDIEHRFKRDADGVFRQQARRMGTFGSVMELRDVPQQFLQPPAKAQP